MPRSSIVRPQSQRDIVLQLALTVTPEGVDFNFQDFTPLEVNRNELESYFQGSGYDLRDGTFQFRITAAGVFVTDDADVYTADEWTAIVDQGSAFGKILMEQFGRLIAAYRGMVTDDATLGQIVRAAIGKALLINSEEDPLKKDFRAPELAEIEEMKFRRGCATCSFMDRSDFIAMFSGKPALRRDVVTVAGVNILVMQADGLITAIVGYLAHENPFERVFHEDLVARLQPLLTPELVRSVIQDHLVIGEVARRINVREQSAILEAYGFSADELTQLADAKEAEVEDTIRRRREMVASGPGGMLAQLFGGDVQIMELGEDGSVPAEESGSSPG